MQIDTVTFTTLRENSTDDSLMIFFLFFFFFSQKIGLDISSKVS